MLADYTGQYSLGADPGIQFEPVDVGAGYGCPAGTCSTLVAGVPKCKHPGGGMTDVILGGPVRTPCAPDITKYLPWAIGLGFALFGGVWIFSSARGQRRDLGIMKLFRRRRKSRRMRRRRR